MKGLKREHGEEDMYATAKSQLSSKLGDRLAAKWEVELRKKKKPSLLYAMFSVFKWEIVIYGFFAVVFELVR